VSVRDKSLLCLLGALTCLWFASSWFFNGERLPGVLLSIVSGMFLYLSYSFKKDYNLSIGKEYMGSKIVALINEEEGVTDVCNRIHQRKTFLNKRLQNLEKQVEEAHKTMHDDNAEDWKTLTDWLKEKERIPKGFNEQTHIISFNVEEGGIKLTKKGHNNSPFPGVKNTGVFQMEELPPELQESMKSFIETKMEQRDE